MSKQLLLDVHGELIIDNFAGGGGASTGIELALGRRVDIAINHDPEAVAMHTANHPETKHYCESVWEIDPREVTQGRPVGLVWLSPDCKHFSKAKGGKPVEKKIRGLAWVALRWAAVARPRVIMLENVEEFRTWGPLLVDGDGKARPCPKNKGREFNAFCNALRRQGYHVEHRELRACDYGTPTIRKRLFLIARRDGQPIVWPEATHYDPADKRFKERKGRILNPDGVVMQPWRTAAECIDFTLPCPSIFERTRPLADATLRRIAKGIMRYVVNSAEPFIVKYYGQKSEGEFRGSSIHEPIHTQSTENRFAIVAPVLTEHANASTPRCMPADEPLRTICAQTKGGHHALIAPTLVQTGYGEREGQAPRALDMDKPLGTLVGSQKHALVSAFMAKHYGGVVGHSLQGEPLHTVTSSDHNSLVTANLIHMGHGEGKDGTKRFSHGIRDIDQPINTITANGATAGIVTSNMIKLRNNCVGQDNREPLHTVTGGAEHFAEVRAFLIKYYGSDQDPRLEEPLHTVTTKDRYGLVTVAGEEYQIADIGLRMLAPKELFKAQGFPDSYITEWGIDHNGQRINLTKSAQVRMCGNSVCPPLAAALVRANLPEMAITRRAA
jgi:DNA (cytosine-5)-methyltransferase 1